jgi:hypothetical protein
MSSTPLDAGCPGSPAPRRVAGPWLAGRGHAIHRRATHPLTIHRLILALPLCVPVLAGNGQAAPADSHSSPPTVGPDEPCRTIKDTAARLHCYDRHAAGDPAALPKADGMPALATWRGRGSLRTRPFHVEGPWELQWASAKGLFAVTLHRMSGEGPKSTVLANGIDGARGSAFLPSGGDFYVQVEAMQAWSAKAVPVDESAPHAAAADGSPGEEPLVAVSGDQSGLPPCNSVAGRTALRQAIEDSPLARTLRITVQSIGDIATRPVRDGMTICRANVVMKAEEGAYDFQYVRRDGQIAVIGQPARQ